MLHWDGLEAEGGAAVISGPAEHEFCGTAGRVTERPGALQPDAATRRGLYHIRTFGCQMNMADSERMAGILETMGYACTAEADDANVLVYNTCSIRDKSEQKVYSTLGRQAKRKRRAGEDLKIVVAGCVATQEGETLLRRVPEVDLVMGPHHANRLDSLLEQVDLGSQVVAVEPIHIVEDIATPRRESAITAWVNVIYGCNERCSYCVVPNVRGLEQSREADAIQREVWALGEAGYKEITLLGQNVDAYGRDLGGVAADGSGRRRWTFTDLLHHVAGAPGIERIRFATSHPRYFTKRLIRACHELPQVCEHFHVPHQHGDDQILREMSRGYTVAKYREIVANIRELMPMASISTDVIVGFPGETEEQYQKTEDLVRELGFDRVNTAAYSPRPNTPAAERPDQVAELIKMDRLNRLNRVCLKVAEEVSQRFVGEVVDVLVEDVNPKVEGQVMGRTRENKLCYFEGDLARDQGKLVDVRVTRATASCLYADRVSGDAYLTRALELRAR